MTMISGRVEWFGTCCLFTSVDLLCKNDISDIFGPPTVAVRFLWNRVCLSVLPSVLLSRHFLGNVSLVFSKFWHGARNPCEVVSDRARSSRKIQNWEKTVF